MNVVFDNTDAGLNADQPPEKLPGGMWTDSRNVVYRDGAAEKAKGYTAALGSLSFTAVYLSTISDGQNQFWVYGRSGASTEAVYATDGSTHANISSTSYTLTATDDLAFNGGAFHGQLIINEGSRDPQSWLPSLSNKMQPLNAWPSNVTAKVVRTFKDFIFALRITDTGTYNPRLLRWSDLAAPAALPSSWDFTDPTNRAGRKEFGETPDNLVDCLPLRDSLIVYKEQHTWIGQYIDLPDVFAFRQLFSESGLLAEDCARPIKSRHFAVTPDDIILHDGNAAESIISGRTRRWLFNRINTNLFRRCFVVADYREREMLFCFPEAGNDWPNLALVWNWHENTFSPRELGVGMTFGMHGIVPGSAAETFDSSSGTFDSDPGVFDQETYSPFQLRAMFASSSSQEAYQYNEGELDHSSTMTAYAIRSYIPLDRGSEFKNRILSLRPRVRGTVGDQISMYVGLRNAIDESVNFQGPYNFTIGQDYKTDVLGQDLVARWVDFKFQYTGTNTVRVSGLEIETVKDGRR